MSKKILVATLVMLVFLFLRTSLLSLIQGFTLLPDFILISLVYFAFYKGSWTGQFAGFYIGLAMDFLSLAPLGYNTFLFTTLGFIIGSFKGAMITDKLLFPLLAAFLATNGKVLLGNLINLIFQINGDITWPNSLIYWKWIGLNMVFAPLVFFLLSILDKRLLPERKAL